VIKRSKRTFTKEDIAAMRSKLQTVGPKTDQAAVQRRFTPAAGSWQIRHRSLAEGISALLARKRTCA
jgi:hypothetical protein